MIASVASTFTRGSTSPCRLAPEVCQIKAELCLHTNPLGAWSFGHLSPGYNFPDRLNATPMKHTVECVQLVEYVPLFRKPPGQSSLSWLPKASAFSSHLSNIYTGRSVCSMMGKSWANAPVCWCWHQPLPAGLQIVLVVVLHVSDIQRHRCGSCLAVLRSISGSVSSFQSCRT